MPTNQATKVVYKGNGNNEFFVIANPGMVSKWRHDKTIPLIDVVQNFEVHTTPTGSNTGGPIRPSTGVLMDTFDTTNEDEIVKKIISEGEEKGL
ncbi:ribosome maturation protein [Cokeromyces recurvatus]|uniref:ribosome maturation protein n=1 Tax=Cokeromyces recurvatus TaxID=90255 RepID=UPI00221E99D1|nr:ribosome maturation protein [Cokeromyces recurvatus]KAI7907108.1 ribosome maturation protein [Cokeromyces recurvatus]